ncbi:MAG TPA: hypothetical protein HPP97_05680 [Desulfuromonadales bacterium]|nr:hypothetical protein [Desulfuromonadales bacterium]
MSQVKPSHLFFTLALATALCGCGSKNDTAVFTSDYGHPQGWNSTHKLSAKADLETCIQCHGENLNGGISQVSCTSCHLGGSAAIHPVQWGNYAYARHKGFVAVNGTSSCATISCHGTLLTGVSGSGPACATACHIGGQSAKHPANWTVISSNVLQNPKGHANYVKANGYTSCAANGACHGADSNSLRGVFLSGPSCFSCHPAEPTVVNPVPDKHPHNRLVSGSFKSTHKDFINTVGNGSVSTCWTNICHGTSGQGVAGSGPKCFNNSELGCHVP